MRFKAEAIVDVSEMVRHALSFLMYLVSAVSIIYANSWRTYITNLGYLAVGIFWITCYFISQFLLSIILYKLCSELRFTNPSVEDNRVSRVAVG